MNAVVTTPQAPARPAAAQQTTTPDSVRLVDIQNTPVVLDFDGGSLTSDAR